jgi:hypothetical protein
MQSLKRFWRSWPKLKNGRILNRFAFVSANTVAGVARFWPKAQSHNRWPQPSYWLGKRPGRIDEKGLLLTLFSVRLLIMSHLQAKVEPIANRDWGIMQAPWLYWWPLRTRRLLLFNYENQKPLNQQETWLEDSKGLIDSTTKPRVL